MKNKNLRKEYGRIKEAIRNTDSPYLRRDYEKYLKRLEREMKYGSVNREIQKGRR